MDLGVGVERSVAATKTYLGSLQALALIAAELAPDRVSADWLDRVPELVTDLAAAQLRTRERFDALADCGLLTAVGRGLDYSTACESALKLRELSGIPAEGFSPPDLIHGPLGALGAKTGVWLVGTGAPQEAEALEMFERIRARAGVAVAVSADRRLLARRRRRGRAARRAPGLGRRARRRRPGPGRRAAARRAPRGRGRPSERAHQGHADPLNRPPGFVWAVAGYPSPVVGGMGMGLTGR